MTVQPGLCQTWSEHQIVGFLTHRLIFKNAKLTWQVKLLPDDVDISRLTRLMASLRNPEITRSLIILLKLFSNLPDDLNRRNRLMLPQRTTSNIITINRLFSTALSTIVLNKFPFINFIVRLFYINFCVI